mgnify:CR=1 FL=1
MLATTEDRWGIKNLQNCILNIAKYIDCFCSKNGIEYYLMGGSALGAIRHKGFIPWDDDLDIFMTLDNYEKFRNAFKESGNKRDYYLHELGASNGKLKCAKIRMNKSTLIEDAVADMDLHHGVFIDIFILHNCPKPKTQRIWQYFWSRYLVTKSLANRKNLRGGLGRKIVLSIMRLFPKRFLLDYSLCQIYRFRNSPSDEYCHFLGHATLSRGTYKKKQFGTPKRVPFELTELNVPEKTEEYLRDRFGDYMKLPNTDEIKLAQHASHWDVNNAFTPVKEGTFADEKYLL